MSREICAFVESDEECLLCPLCGENYLHQEKVTVYDRASEDADGLITEIEGGKSTVRHAPAKDLIGRRNALTIKFSCEQGCSGALKLLIQQHKGLTLIGWIDVEVAS